MRVAFHTLGCKVNHYETEAIKEAFVSRGADVADEEGFADVYVINTCTVTNIADRKSRQFIRRAKKVNPHALIVVTGCYAQVASEEVAAMPEVDLIIGNGHKSEICGLVMKKLAGHGGNEAPAGDAARPPANEAPAGDAARPLANEAPAGDAARPPANEAAGRHSDILVSPRSELTYYEDMGRIGAGAGGMTRAYIKIQDGCDRFCSYCLIPYARGPVRSRPSDEIVEEVGTLVESGFREVVLAGINTALYGTEPGADCTLSELLTKLDDLEVRPREEEGPETGGTPGTGSGTEQKHAIDFRVRLSSLEPTVVDKDNVEEIIRHRRLCHHLHLSVQAGSDNMLRAMNRHYDRAEYLNIVKAIRGYDPLFGITTDIIVGFPGETDSDFTDSLDIVREAGFGRTHVFRYSPRRGTAGAAMKDRVAEETKKRRAEELERMGEETARAFIGANRGVCHTVLIEEHIDGYAVGYTGNYIRVYIPDDEDDIQAGEFCDVIIGGPFRDGAAADLIPAGGTEKPAEKSGNR